MANKKFLAIYLGSMDAARKWNASEAERQAGVNAWAKWATDNSASITDHGGPLGKTKHIDSAGISDTKNSMTGYVLIEAATHDEAAAMFLNHPHFTLFPGDSVEIMECLPMPGA